jgi:hypothetical protein
MAEDWQIFDPQGRKISNRGMDETGLYRAAAVEGLARLMVTDPELAKRFAWGGHFGTQIGGGGTNDLMHYDIGGPRGHFGDPLGERADAARRAKQIAEAGPLPGVPGSRGANGTVNVNIRHRNAPTGTTVETNSAGDVNVAPVRREWQDMAQI